MTPRTLPRPRLHAPSARRRRHPPFRPSSLVAAPSRHPLNWDVVIGVLLFCSLGSLITSLIDVCWHLFVSDQH